MRIMSVLVLCMLIAISGPACSKTDPQSGTADSNPMEVAASKSTSKSAAKPAATKPAPAKAAPAKEEPAKAAPAEDAKKPASAPAAVPSIKVIKSWDFKALPQDKWEWYFPGGTPAKTVRGAYYTVTKDGPGLQFRDQTVDVTDVTHVRIKMLLTQLAADSSSKVVPLKALHFFFNPADSKPADPKWPFDNKHSVTLRPVKGEPNVFVGELLGREDWKGTMKDFFFNVCVPELSKEDLDKGVKYGVATVFVEFVNGPKLPDPTKAPEMVIPTGVVKEWDFAKLEKDKWDWRFPGGTPAKVEKGAYYFTTESGRGPILENAKFDAKNATHVRVTMWLIRNEGNKVTKSAAYDSISLYFTRDSDPEAKEKWPFSNKRGVTLKPVKGQNGVFVGRLDGQADWNGTISNFFINANVPKLSKEEVDKGVKFGVGVSKIEFLK